MWGKCGSCCEEPDDGHQPVNDCLYDDDGSNNNDDDDDDDKKTHKNLMILQESFQAEKQNTPWRQSTAASQLYGISGQEYDENSLQENIYRHDHGDDDGDDDDDDNDDADSRNHWLSHSVMQTL